MCGTHGPQWFMWGGWLYDTHNHHQSEVHTGPQGVGFRRHIYFTLGPQWFMWDGWLDATPTGVPHWSSGGGIQTTRLFLRLCPKWFMWGGWLDDEFSLHRGS